MGFWGGLGKALGIAGGAIAAPFTGGASLIPTIAGAAGAGLGAISQSQASNRGEKFGGQLDLERLLLQRDLTNQNLQIGREREGRESGQDAWRRLLSAQRTLSPGPRPQLSPYSIAPRQATGAERQGADAMTQEVLARLMGGNPIPEVVPRAPAVDPKLLNPGLFERIAGYASPALGAWSRIAGQQQPPIPSRQLPNYLTQAPRIY